jgi:CheY-like chemotaxis protein
VLIVDDNATNRRILEEILTNWGMVPTVVDGGEAGLRALDLAVHGGTPFGLVLVDDQMPGMDGFQLAERIKGNSKRRTSTIMMLSSVVNPGQTARCAELGVAAHLTKPIRQAVLLDAILAILDKTNAHARRASLLERDTDRGERRTLRVLVAEDNPVNQVLMVRILEKHGHLVVIAEDGRAALAAVAAGPFDVALMDVQMPELDGFQVTAAIREQERGTGRHLPIIALTAHAMRGDRERCLSAGMDGYLAKPIHAADLYRTLQEFTLVTAEPGTEPTTEAPGTAGSPINPHTLDELRALDTRGQGTFLSDMIQAYLKSAPERLAAIRLAAEAKDAKELQRQLHSYRGISATLGADRLAGLCQNVEALAATGLLDEMEPLLDGLAQEFVVVRGALESNMDGYAETVEVKPS